MDKDMTYHSSAIQYNEGLAEAAEALAKTVEHPEIKKWCTAVGKQHRFHAKMHRGAQAKLMSDGEDETKTPSETQTLDEEQRLFEEQQKNSGEVDVNG